MRLWSYVSVCLSVSLSVCLSVCMCVCYSYHNPKIRILLNINFTKNSVYFWCIRKSPYYVELVKCLSCRVLIGSSLDICLERLNMFTKRSVREWVFRYSIESAPLQSKSERFALLPTSLPQWIIFEPACSIFHYQHPHSCLERDSEIDLIET